LDFEWDKYLVELMVVSTVVLMVVVKVDWKVVLLVLNKESLKVVLLVVSMVYKKVWTKDDSSVAMMVAWKVVQKDELSVELLVQQMDISLDLQWVVLMEVGKVAKKVGLLDGKKVA
jgi:hypothetical protein